MEPSLGGRWVQCHVRCCPATHMVGDLSLWSGCSARRQESRVPVLCRVVPSGNSCQEGSFGLRRPFGSEWALGGVLGVFLFRTWRFCSDFELREAGVLFFLLKSRVTNTSTYSFLECCFTPAVLRWIISKMLALHSYKSFT